MKVITREEIEKRHYTDITEAIKRIPGVTFQNPGYRGSMYDWSPSAHGVSINGDYHVVVLVDGRRVDNSTSMNAMNDWQTTSEFSKSTGVDLNQVTNMENVDKIEVIKGPGASVYGSDATGGVINIITRKGGSKPVATVDVSTGNWNQHKYALSYSGSAGDDGSLHYFISANREMSGDTKFKDGFTGREGEVVGSKYKEDGVNFRIDKEFDENHNLKIWFNHKSGKDGMPLTTPDMRYYTEDGWKKLIFAATTGTLDENNKIVHWPDLWNYGNTLTALGYRNLFVLDGAYGSFSKFNNNDLDVTYTFNKDNGMESFVRVYNQSHRYSYRDIYYWGIVNGRPLSGNSYDFYYDYLSRFPNGATDAQLNEWMNEHLAPFPGGDKNALEDFINKTGGKATDPTGYWSEKNRGIQLQYAKSIGIHDIISSVTYDKARTYRFSTDRNTGKQTSNYVQRKTVRGYLQDKIHITDKWDFTPSLRYAWYSSFTNKSQDGTITDGKGNSHNFNYALNTEYMFNDSTSMYLGWTKVYRAVKKGDYDTTDDLTDGSYLKDEKGNVWTLGIRKELSDKTTLRINYDWTHMSNAIATIRMYNPKTEKIGNYNVNAKEDKKSFNITLDSQLNDHWTISAAYDHSRDKWESKNGWDLVSDYIEGLDMANINNFINYLRPGNHYSVNVSYDNNRLYSGLLVNWYTGNSTLAFSDRHFLILDWNINYELKNGTTLYALVNNLTNEGYQTSYSSSYGAGAMAGRSYLIGMKYKF